MNILLVAVNAKYIHTNPAVYSLRSCTGAYRSCVTIAEYTINQQPSFILQDIYKRHPHVIAFSCYIWNRTLISQIICDLHKLLPDTDIWAGGPEVSYHPAETIDEWKLRGVMAGPGEGSFSHLVSAYVRHTAGRLPAVLDITNTPKLLLDDIPFWQEELTDFEHRIMYYESSRGCPFSCSYCLSSIDKAMDFRSVGRVCRELDFFLERKVPQVKFIDRTFNCSKKHALPILQHLLEHDNGITNFHFEIAADLLDEDYFAVLAQMRPGAVQLEIGVQSTHARTIAAVDRKMDLAKVAAAVQRIRSWHNIHIHLDLIAGLPFEDLRTFQTSFQEVYDLHPAQLQLGFLKVLKGSAMESRAPGYDLVSSSQPPYEVLSTRWLSYEDICQLKQAEEVLEIYYNSGQFAHTLDFLLPYFETPYAMYHDLASWYETHGLFGIQSSRIRKYEILLEFGTAYITADAHKTADTQKTAVAHKTTDAHKAADTKLPDDPGRTPDHLVQKQLSAFREYLTYDLYLREHMKNRPSFAFPQDQWKHKLRSLLQEEAGTHARFPEYKGYSYRELTKVLHIEVFETIFDHPSAVLFGYKNRDPLTNNGTAVQISLDN